MWGELLPDLQLSGGKPKDSSAVVKIQRRTEKSCEEKLKKYTVAGAPDATTGIIPPVSAQARGVMADFTRRSVVEALVADVEARHAAVSEKLRRMVGE